MTRQRSTLADSRIYAAANIINRLAGLALIPVYAHLLAPADFGVYAVVQSVIELASILVGMGFSSAMNRFFLEYPQDQSLQRRVVSTALTTVAGIGLVIALASPLLAWVSARLLLGDTDHALLFGVALVGLVFAALFEIGGAYLVVRKRARRYFVLSAAKAVLLIAANVVCVVLLRGGVLGILAATALAMAVLALAHTALILREVGWGFSRDLARRLWRFGLPLVPSALAHAALPVVERYFLHALSGAGAVGLYALASRLAALLQMFLALPFSQTFSVRRIETLVKGQDQAANDRALLLFVWLMSCAVLLLSALAVELMGLLAAPEYAGAAQLVPLLGLSQVLAALNFNLELGLHFSKQTGRLPWISLVALALSVPANAALAGPWGALGSALALLLVNVARLVLTWRLNARYGTSQIRLDWLRAGGLMVVCTVAGLVLVHWPSGNGGSLVTALLKLALAGGLALALVWSPLLDAQSRRDLLGALRRGARH